MSYEKFERQLESAVIFFNSYNKNSAVKVISHHDCDGICSAAIILSLLKKKGIKTNLTIIPQLDSKFLEEAANEDYELTIFTDLGSARVKDISEKFSGKDVIILDHHVVSDFEAPENIVHVNPHLVGIDGSKEISGAGVVYRFAELIDPSIIELSHLAVIGAVGDCQEKRGFKGLNYGILQKAIGSGMIEELDGIKLFGAFTRPLAKLLKQSFDPYIPGVTGSDNAARGFLSDLGITLKKDGRYRMLHDLNKTEKQKLLDGLMKKVPGNKKHLLTGKSYIIPNEEDPYFKDVREYSTILNSCGRLDKANIGVGACLGDLNNREQAVKILSDYRHEILNILEWFKKNRGGEDISEGDNYLIINARENVIPTIAGTLASVLAYSSELKRGIHILTMARTGEGTTKISLRMSGGAYSNGANLNDVIGKIVAKVGGQSGGHQNAAGAMIESSKEEEFIDSAVEVFNSY